VNSIETTATALDRIYRIYRICRIDRDARRDRLVQQQFKSC